MCIRDSIRTEKSRELCFPFGAPGKDGLQRVGEAALRIHAMRVDGEAGVLAREALLGLREAEVVAQHVEEVGRVAAVEDAEPGREADALRVAADQAVGDRVVGARPGQAHFLQRFGDDALRAARHLLRRAAREGEEQDALGRRAGDEQVRDAMRERVGLARAGAGEDEERRVAEGRRFFLPGVQHGGNYSRNTVYSVSYTHLTLP